MSDTPEKAAYTKGSIASTMLRTAFSMLPGTLAMSGYNLVDTFFVGQLGRIPLAAIGFTLPVIMLIGCVFHGMGAGIMTTAAQSLGSGRKEKACVLVSSGIWLVLLVSTLLALLGILTGRMIFSALGACGQTLDEVMRYMNIWFWGNATASIGMVGNNILISAGDSRTAGGIMVTGLVLNALLDPLMIFGWGWFPAMGIGGAALATVIAQGVTAYIGLHVLYRKWGLLKFHLYPPRELKGSWGMVIRFAVPASIGMLMMPIGATIITWITARFGDAAVAATGAAGRLEMVAFVFPMSFGISLMPMIGQNFGARLYSRLRGCHRFAMTMAFCYLTFMALLYFFFSRYLVRFFSEDAEVQKLMILCLLITPWGFAGVEIHRFSGFFYMGCGRPAVAAWLNAFRILGLMIPFSFLALYFDSLALLFAARLIADAVAGFTGWYLSRRMLKNLPADGEVPPPHQDHGGFLKYLTISRLKGLAHSQTVIDASSDTQ